MTLSRNLSGCQVFKEAELPAAWDCVPLGTRIELAYGKGLREEDRKPGKVDVYGSNGRVGSHDVALVNGAGILVGRKGTVGAVHYSPRSFWPIDTVYYVLQLAGDDARFLHHLLEYLPLRSLNAATGVPGLSRRDAYTLRGAFPPPSEQAAIARILDAVDTSLECTRAAVARALDLKQAVLDRFFHDALGFTAYANRSRRRLPDGWALVATGMLLAEEPRNGISPQASSQPAHAVPTPRTHGPASPAACPAATIPPADPAGPARRPCRRAPPDPTTPRSRLATARATPPPGRSGCCCACSAYRVHLRAVHTVPTRSSFSSFASSSTCRNAGHRRSCCAGTCRSCRGPDDSSPPRTERQPRR